MGRHETAWLLLNMSWQQAGGAKNRQAQTEQLAGAAHLPTLALLMSVSKALHRVSGAAEGVGKGSCAATRAVHACPG